MSKALRTVGVVAGLAGSFALAAGSLGVGSPVTAALLSKIGTYAALAGSLATTGSALIAKKPPARGSSTSISIGTDQPSPYIIGRSYYGGSRQYQRGYGPMIDKVPNPYAWIVDVYSVAGPIEAIDGYYADFASLGIASSGGPASGYASGFLWGAVQRGLVPEPSALVPHYAGAPAWGAAYRLSGKAAVGWSLLFDRKGKVFASGVPQLGVVARGVRVYDPRLDSSYPGGAGPQRITDETTWTWSENPGLHALTYAYGRYQMGVKVFGVGIPMDGIIVDHFVHLANVCDANGWTLGGVIFEPASKWTNLKDILAAGGAEPCFVGGRMGLRISAPRIALDTISEEDLADGEIVIGAMQGWEERLNTLIPKYRSEPHKWEYVQSTTPVTIATYVVEDGEVKQEERQLNLVQDKDQAAQLCAYELLDRRELGEITLTCKPRLRRYGPGDLLIVDIEEAGLIQQPCVILKRSIDPETMTVSFVLRGETPGKHAFALGQIGTAPPTPMLRSTADLDGNVAPISDRGVHVLYSQSTAYPVTSEDDSISVAAFSGVIDDGRSIAFPAATIGGLTAGTAYRVFWRLSTSTYLVVLDPALTETADDDLVYIRSITTANADGTYPAGPTPPGGDGGNGSGGNCITVDMLVLMADGSWRRAGDLKPGDVVRTQHENTLVWEDHRISAVSISREAVFVAPGYPTATARHLFREEGWFAMERIGTSAGCDDVVRITVPGAATYVARHPDAPLGVLSHNLKPVEP